MHPDLTGFEFDWFAVDTDGNLALFATAGEGFVPESAAEHHVDHSALSDSLPAPRVGTPQVWQDYADAGLYVFDWVLPGGPYERRESPAARPNAKLQAEVLALPELPRFGASFRDARKVESWL